MSHAARIREIAFSLRDLFLDLLLVVPVALLAGSASALFLWGLDWVTSCRWRNDWLIWFLPVAGIPMVLLYRWLGGESGRGNNLIIEQIHEPGGGVPRRMAPLILGATLLTHLVGGSAGREGTAIQMGGSLASFVGRSFRVAQVRMPVLLKAGISAGFGSVFGTPVAGAVFALEVLTLGRVRYDALIPVLFSAVLGDVVCRAWGIVHFDYHSAVQTTPLPVGANPAYLLLLGQVVVASLFFAWVARGFAEVSSLASKAWLRWVPALWLRPVIGGALLLALCWLLGTQDYLGLGSRVSPVGHVAIETIFSAGGATTWSWFWKFLFTIITLSCGFKGGEVTPLFFIGAALGHALGLLLGAPIDLLAALGFVAVFAGATNTPLACTIMGVELFGAGHIELFAVACFLSYFLSGHTGIYSAQRLGVHKASGHAGREGDRLGELHRA